MGEQRRAVYKYPLEITDEQVIRVSEEHRVVLVGLQHGVPTIWIEVDPSAPQPPHRFFVHGTGHPIVPGAVHVGSFQQAAFVWHVYEEVSRG